MKTITKLSLLLIVLCTSCQMIQDYGLDERIDSYGLGLGGGMEVQEMEVFTNPTDPTVAKVITGDGTEFVFFGEKNNSGDAESIDYFYTKYAGESDYYITQLNDNLLPERVTAPNGYVYQYDYPLDTVMLITISAPTDGQSIGVLLSPNDFKSDLGLTPIQPDTRRTEIPDLVVNNHAPTTFNSQKGMDGNMSFQIYQCGKLVKDATVTLLIDPPITESKYTSSGDNTGNYSFKLPSDAEQATAEKLCQSVVNGLLDVCLAYNTSNTNITGDKQNPPNVICDKMLKKITNKQQNLSQSMIDEITAICPMVVGGFPSFCTVNEFLTENKITKDACLKAYETYQLFAPDVKYSYQINVSIPGYGTETSEMVNFDPNDPGSYEWDVGGEFHLGLINIKGNPAPGGIYHVSCDVVCPVDGGVLVTISISGSDDFSASDSKSFQQTGSIGLSNIPGGEEGVVDVIVVSCKIDGLTYESSTSIVF